MRGDKRSVGDRLARLEQLKGLLAAGSPGTVPVLAAELGVSARTLARDLAVLRDQGLPVEADAGRGGGVRLAASWRFGRLQLDHGEAIDLLLALAIAERQGSPVLLDSVRALRRKVAAAFADRPGGRVADLRRRILIGGRASDPVLSGYAPPPRAGLQPLARGFFELRCIRFDYVDGSGQPSGREVEPQVLLLNPPVWYLVGWDRGRAGIRTFRLDRMRSVTLSEARFRLRPAEPYREAADRMADPL